MVLFDQVNKQTGRQRFAPPPPLECPGVGYKSFDTSYLTHAIETWAISPCSTRRGGTAPRNRLRCEGLTCHGLSDK